MPAANQAGLGSELRMRRTGLSQLAGGGGTSTSSIRKSPFGASASPAPYVLCSVKGATASQISVAKTLALALKPMALPPPSSRPRPSTWIRPSTFTSALRAEITQIWPGGWTPRTMLRVTTSAVAACPTPAATGRTPIPPRNFTRVSSATADSGNSATTNGKRTKAFFMVSPPPTWLDPPGRTRHAIARCPPALGDPPPGCTALVERLRRERPEVPLHVVAAQARVGHALLRVDEVLELGRVADEEDWCVVADEVVVALLRVEFQGEAARVAVGIAVALLAGHRGEAGEHGGALAHLVEESGLGPRRNVRRHLEVAERAAALGVGDALGHALAVERL